MLKLSERVVRKARSMRADVRALYQIAERPVALLPWLLTSGRGPHLHNQLHAFDHNGVRFVVRPRDLLGLREILVDDEYGFVRDLLRPQHVVIDLGANVGLFAVGVLAAEPTTDVHSYEPSKQTYEVLRANRGRNPHLSWSCYWAAAYDGPGIVRFSNRSYSTGSRVAEDGDELVPTVGLDGVLARAGGRAHLVKIDIEGSEQKVLSGSEHLLEHIDTVVLEIHPDRCVVKNLLRILRDAYPHLHRVPGRRSSKPLVVASRQRVDLPPLG